MLEAPKEPDEAAAIAGLRYTNDEIAGIKRLGRPGHFHYKREDGKSVGDDRTLARIRKLAIPPAWTKVWIAPSPVDHLQATGRDAKGRKQYRYHPKFVAVRDVAKYAHLAEFATSLPALRKRIRSDLKRKGLPREKVMAAIVALLEETLIRVGNEDYARSNASFGLTTLRNRHVKVRGKALTFQFKGKSGKLWDLSIEDRRVANIVARCQELPGQHLFEYIDENDAVKSISSTDVNAYLREISGKDITAKDFRTWSGTVDAAATLSRIRTAPSKKIVRQAIGKVAERLGNTIAVCRRCYIHPHIIELFEASDLALNLAQKGRAGFSPAEYAVLTLLKKAASKGR